MTCPRSSVVQGHAGIRVMAFDCHIVLLLLPCSPGAELWGPGTRHLSHVLPGPRFPDRSNAVFWLLGSYSPSVLPEPCEAQG